MTSIADGSVCIQTFSEAVAATPSWFGEVVLLTVHLRKRGGAPVGPKGARSNLQALSDITSKHNGSSMNLVEIL